MVLVEGSALYSREEKSGEPGTAFLIGTGDLCREILQSLTFRHRDDGGRCETQRASWRAQKILLCCAGTASQTFVSGEDCRRYAGAPAFRTVAFVAAAE